MTLNLQTHYLKMRVLVEPTTETDSPDVLTYTEEEQHLLPKVLDFIVTLGGDGTLLHISSLLSNSSEKGTSFSPPILSFHLGTLGILMPFNVDDFKVCHMGVNVALSQLLLSRYILSM